MVETLKSNWLLIVILLVGAFMRLYKIDAYMTFLGDEGRDSIIVRNLLVNADPILIGPGTSIGSMYLGPLYYYFMAPFLFLSNFSPVGPAIGVALLGIATIYLVFIAGKDWLGEKAGLIAAALFAISPTVIIYSHSSWNPNIMPFFALLSIYSIWRVWKLKQYKWLIITAISFAFVLQSHYLGVLIAPVLIIYWYLSKVPKRYSLISILSFLFLMSPLLIFDIRHDWMNSKAFYKFITVREETLISINPISTVSKIYPIYEQVNTSLLTAKNEVFGKYISIFIIVLLIFIYIRDRKLFTVRYSEGASSAYLLITLWLLTATIGLGLYKQEIHDHYFGFLFPASFLLIGFLLSNVFQSKYKMVGIIIFIFLVLINLGKNPFLKNPNNQMRRAQNVAYKVLEIVDSKPFNLAVLAERNYEDGYKYFLEKENLKVVDIDSQFPETVTDQLLVICENLRDKCDPTHSAKAEVANFGWSKIDSDYEVDGVIIFKLIHTK